MTIGAASASSLSAYELDLARRVEAEALACIGCNDCLLACPIPEARSVTIGELNRALHLPVISAQNVATFVTACTQCGQCVPACPADLSRAQMVLYNKLKVEDSVQDFELSLSARTVTFPARITRNALAAELEGLEVFRDASSQALRRLVQKSTLRLLVPGEVLCEEGEFHERLCIVLSGALDQLSRGARGEAVHLLTLGPGAFFGEMGILGDAPEPFEVVAREKSIVLESPKVAALRLLAEAPSGEQTLTSLYERRALWTYAKSPGALGALPDSAIAELFQEARLTLLSSGHTLFEKGAQPSDFFLVRSGFLRAVQRDDRGERVLTYFREGNVFGVLPLLNREPAQRYSVFAVSRSEVIRVPGATLARVLARYPGVEQALAQGAFEAERLARASDVGLGPLPIRGPLASIAPGSRSGASNPSLPGERAPLEAAVLVERGIAKGREVLVIDQTRCTGCGNCIDACERRHGKSRLQLRGIQVENYLFPSACRHCEDPACLLCSVNGIARLPSGEIHIVSENCIGCGSCAERCPYGSISMHAAEPKPRGFLPTLRDFLAGPTRRQALEAIEPNQARVAVKCDLCARHSDYACVTACPTAAAFRVNPQAALRGESDS